MRASAADRALQLVGSLLTTRSGNDAGFTGGRRALHRPARNCACIVTSVVSSTKRHPRYELSACIGSGRTARLVDLRVYLAPVPGSCVGFNIQLLATHRPIIRLHRSTAYVDAAYCYRPSSVVFRSVCHSSEPCENGSTDRDAVWVEDSGGPKEPRIRWGSDPVMERGNFKGERGRPIVKYSGFVRNR